MPEDNTTNDSLNTQSTQNNGGTHIYAFGMDSNAQSDMANVEKMKATLEACGNKVYFTQIGPNQETYLAQKAKEVNADTCIFACLVAPATIWSFGKAVQAGTLPHTIFAIEGWMAKAKSLEDVRNTPWKPEWDAGQFMTGSSTSTMQSEASTVGEWVDKNSEYISICYGSTPEELAQNICNGSFGSGSTGSVVDSGGGTQIKDKTFEKCIRRICAATDSVFLVENNVAILFPYTDWLAFTLRQKITTITPNEIDPNVFMMEYNTQGFYNKVTIAWGDTELPERTFDTNVPSYQQQSQTSTTINKGTTTQELNVDTNGDTLLSEQYDALVKKYGVLEKRVKSKAQNYETAQYLANALLIQYVRDFNNSCQCRAISNRKYLGGTFYNVTNPFTNEQEILYLNGYTMRAQKDTPLYFDLDFRYGPESAEDISDYQQSVSGSGGSGGGSSSGITGGESADINALAQDICKGINDDYQKMVAVHEYLRTHVKYDWHECTRYNTPSECLKHIDDLNCADTARLTRALMSAAGLNATVVHGNYHFWTIITINGKEYASDATSSRRGINEVWNQGPFDYHEKNGDAPSC